MGDIDLIWIKVYPNQGSLGDYFEMNTQKFLDWESLMSLLGEGSYRSIPQLE